jgi:hypothetical protein
MTVVILVGVAGVIGILMLAIKGNLDAQDALAMSTADPAGVNDQVSKSTPSNSAGDFTGDMSENDFSPGIKSPIIPTDEDTWPGGDVVWEVARAIARAEGYGVNAANNPTRLNNPGDISDGAKSYGSELHSGSKVTHFPDPATGWNWLYQKLDNIRTGKSSSYSNNLTWLQFAQTWAGNWQPWVNRVTRDLAVGPNDRVGDFWNA